MHKGVHVETERRACAAVSAQTGLPCKRKAAEGALVCKTHMGITAAQKEAMDKGRKKRHDNLKKGGPTQKERWGMLLSGTLTVKDLDDDEIERMRVRGKGGEFSGRAPAVPSHLARAFRAEGIRRAEAQFNTYAPKAVKRLLEIADDPDTKDADAIRALDIILNRGLGRTPEVIHVQTSGFDDVSSKVVDIDRSMVAEAEAILAERTHDKDDAE